MSVRQQALSLPALEGLSSSEARARLQQFGPNVLVPPARRERILNAARSLADPMALMLAAAGAVYLALGKRTEGLVLLGALLPVLGVDVILQARSNAALRKLAAAVAARARVIRDGNEIAIRTEEIVPGDLLFLHEGDVVHADAAVVAQWNLSVDESQLTGESEPQRKVACERGGDEAQAPHEARAFAGSRVLAGHGYARVSATGPETRYGSIARLFSGVEIESTPLQRKTARMIRQIVIAVLGVSAGVFALRFARGTPVGGAFLYAITLAMAAVGEEFALVLTLFLSVGAWRLGRIGVLVRRIASVETLGSTTVICLDKTGTLTAGAYKLVAHMPLGKGMSEDELLEAAALACEPAPVDSMERVILEHCSEHGVNVEALHSRWRLAHDYDFELVGKHMSHVWSQAAGRDGRIVAKGSLEGILEHCQISQAEGADAERANVELAERGARVLAVAGRTMEDGHRPFTGIRDEDERGLKLYGLLAFQDPVRPEVPRAVAECQRAGVKLKLITGDHALTAHAIADAAGIDHHNDSITTGAELDRPGTQPLREVVERKVIFARARPEQKYAIVEALSEAGEVVAMTGDGINDAPALRRADIGVSMGVRGTEVARAAADIVLLEDDFAALVATIREGRRLFGNLEQAFRYLVGFKVMVVAMALAVPVLDVPILLTPIDLVWLELVVHLVSAFSFEGREPIEDVMAQPPRDPARPLLTRAHAIRSAASGALLALGAIALYLALLAQGESVARAVAMAVAVIGSLLLLFAELAGDQPWWEVRAPRELRFWAVCLLVGASAALFVNLPLFAGLLGLAPISVRNWLYAGAAALAAVGWRLVGSGRKRPEEQP